MQLLTVTNLTQSYIAFQDPTGQTALTFTLRGGQTISMAVTHDQVECVQPLLVTAAAEGKITWSSIGADDRGITQLTGDVLAGPGNGSVVATVSGLRGKPLSSATPLLNQYLRWNGTTWAPDNLPLVGVHPALGNVLVVDKVNGDDLTGAVNGSPFQGVEAAIAYINANTLTNVTIWIMPGIYTLAAGIVVPDTCSLRGLSTQTVKMNLAGSNPGGTVTMLTMGENSRVEDMSLTLTSTNATTNLVGVRLPNTTSITSKLRTCTVTVDNSTVAVGTTTNVYGILDDGAGSLGPASFSFNQARACTVNVYSNGGGDKRGVLVSGPAAVTFRDTNFYVRAPVNAASTGSYVGAETTNNLASAQFRTCSIAGSPPGVGAAYTGSDVLQTLPALSTSDYGIQIGPGCDLVNKTAGSKPFTSYTTPVVLAYALHGSIPNAAHYLWPGTQVAADHTEIFYRFQQKAVVFGMSAAMRVAPGVGKSVQFLVKKSTTGVSGSGVGTIMTLTISGTNTAATQYGVSVDFKAGEFLSLEAIPSGASTAEDVVVQLDLF